MVEASGRKVTVKSLWPLVWARSPSIYCTIMAAEFAATRDAERLGRRRWCCWGCGRVAAEGGGGGTGGGGLKRAGGGAQGWAPSACPDRPSCDTTHLEAPRGSHLRDGGVAWEAGQFGGWSVALPRQPHASIGDAVIADGRAQHGIARLSSENALERHVCSRKLLPLDEGPGGSTRPCIALCSHLGAN